MPGNGEVIDAPASPSGLNHKALDDATDAVTLASLSEEGAELRLERRQGKGGCKACKDSPQGQPLRAHGDVYGAFLLQLSQQLGLPRVSPPD